MSKTCPGTIWARMPYSDPSMPPSMMPTFTGAQIAGTSVSCTISLITTTAVATPKAVPPRHAHLSIHASYPSPSGPSARLARTQNGEQTFARPGCQGIRLHPGLDSFWSTPKPDTELAICGQGFQQTKVPHHTHLPSQWEPRGRGGGLSRHHPVQLPDGRHLPRAGCHRRIHFRRPGHRHRPWVRHRSVISRRPRSPEPPRCHPLAVQPTRTRPARPASRLRPGPNLLGHLRQPWPRTGGRPTVRGRCRRVWTCRRLQARFRRCPLQPGPDVRAHRTLSGRHRCLRRGHRPRTHQRRRLELLGRVDVTSQPPRRGIVRIRTRLDHQSRSPQHPPGPRHRRHACRATGKGPAQSGPCTRHRPVVGKRTAAPGPGAYPVRALRRRRNRLRHCPDARPRQP